MFKRMVLTDKEACELAGLPMGTSLTDFTVADTTEISEKLMAQGCNRRVYLSDGYEISFTPRYIKRTWRRRIAYFLGGILK